MRTARDHRVPLSYFRGAEVLRYTETDRLLALALTIFDRDHCDSCGQLRSLCMDPDLAAFWTTMHPVRDYACTAIAEAAERDKDKDHPGALRYVVGLREGWEEHKASVVAGRLASTSEG